MVVVVGLVGGACGGAQRVAEAPVDLTITPIKTPPQAAVLPPPDPRPATGQCALRLISRWIKKSAPGCYLDEHLSEGGTLRYPCGGDGPAEAIFGPQRFAGTMRGGELELSLTTELDWVDGCRWATDATITGRVVESDKTTMSRLDWKYRDRVVSGASCSGVCTATASIEVRPFGASPTEPPEDDEVDGD